MSKAPVPPVNDLDAMFEDNPLLLAKDFSAIQEAIMQMKISERAKYENELSKFIVNGTLNLKEFVSTYRHLIAKKPDPVKKVKTRKPKKREETTQEFYVKIKKQVSELVARQPKSFVIKVIDNIEQQSYENVGTRLKAAYDAVQNAQILTLNNAALFGKFLDIAFQKLRQRNAKVNAPARITFEQFLQTAGIDISDRQALEYRNFYYLVRVYPLLLFAAQSFTAIASKAKELSQFLAGECDFWRTVDQAPKIQFSAEDSQQVIEAPVQTTVKCPDEEMVDIKQQSEILVERMDSDTVDQEELGNYDIERIKLAKVADTVCETIDADEEINQLEQLVREQIKL